jgi:chromosome partitioning protein
MIIIVGGIKGGSGKTTIATNLTVMCASTGNEVLLVDADEQKSASDWAEQRESLGFLSSWTTIQLSGASLNSQILKMVNSYDDIIIDAGGRDTTSQRSALSIADLFLIPFKPRAYDVWTLGRVGALIQETRAVNPDLRCCAFLNQADPSGKDNEEAFGMLMESESFECIDVCIANRKAFGNTATEGLGVVEARFPDKKAVGEMTKLYQTIYNSDLTFI